MFDIAYRDVYDRHLSRAPSLVAGRMIGALVGTGSLGLHFLDSLSGDAIGPLPAGKGAERIGASHATSAHTLAS
jgi:hypothetical protein